MERDIGIDVHAASCRLAVISAKGRKLEDFTVETNGQSLVEAVRMIPGHKHLVMEEGLQASAGRNATRCATRAPLEISGFITRIRSRASISTTVPTR